MKRLFINLTAFSAMSVIGAGAVYANQSEYCDGYTEGYSNTPGASSTAPVCPPMPTLATGETPTLRGVADGIAAAQSGG